MSVSLIRFMNNSHISGQAWFTPRHSELRTINKLNLLHPVLKLQQQPHRNHHHKWIAIRKRISFTMSHFFIHSVIHSFNHSIIRLFFHVVSLNNRIALEIRHFYAADRFEFNHNDFRCVTLAGISQIWPFFYFPPEISSNLIAVKTSGILSTSQTVTHLRSFFSAMIPNLMCFALCSRLRLP